MGTTMTQRVVVGVGASAGGLHAFSSLLESIPPDLPVAWVFVQHLDPTHESMMAELLSRKTKLRVKEAQPDEEVQAGCVYVIPPNRFITIEGNALRLDTPSGERGGRLSIDYLFRSLADSFGRSAIGVVLSGTGSDGTNGLRAIKAAGGFTIAQEPGSAAYDGMPRSAVEQGVADLVLEINEIPEAIQRFLDHPYVNGGRPTGTAGSGEADDEREQRGLDAKGDRHGSEDGGDLPDEFHGVFELLRSELGIDLTLYKSSTLARRVQRRMGLRHVTTLSEYLNLIKQDRTELQELARDVHISVTDFFRDPEAFEVLSERVIPRIFEAASAEPADERIIRVWAPGCATGEEAFSLAIALLEHREKRWSDAGIAIQVFATDVDPEAIRQARAAVYPEACLSNVSEARRDTYFDRLDRAGMFRVRQPVRDLVSFATHNLLSDPPFSRLHLVSCRNLLIYLRREAQEGALSSFHFALEPQGYLFLGPSEALGQAASHFRVIDKRWRIYQRLETQGKQEAPGTPAFLGRRFEPVAMPMPTMQRHQEQRSSELASLRLLAQASTPPSVLINGQHQVVYLHGDLIEFLDLPSGAGGMTLIEMVREEPRTRIRAAVYRASRSRERIVTRGTLHTRGGEQRAYTVTVSPCASTELGDDLLAVTFELGAAPEPDGSTDADIGTVTEELNREVEALRSDLQSTVEELEQTNDALRTSNEESMTMNEELQSTSEELETQSEELRSVNEELITANSLLREKLDELQEAHADIANLLHSTKLPAIFLDHDFCIRRYTPEARKLLSVIESDIGRPIRDLKGVCVDDGMLDDARKVIDGLAPVEKEIQGDDGSWYLRRILPYRTADDRIDGVVITFSQVTRLKELTAGLTAQREQQRAAAEAGVLALREGDFVGLAEHAVNIVARTLGCPMCKVLELTEDRRELLMIAGVGWHDGLVGRATVPNDRGSQAGYTLEAAGPVVVPDLPNETRFSGPALLTDHGVGSGVSVIIFGPGGEPYGVLGVHGTKPRAFDQHQVAFVQQIANVLGGALQRIRVTEDLEESQRKLQAIIDNAPAAIYAKDLQGRFILVNAALGRAVEMDHTKIIGLRDEDLVFDDARAEAYRRNDAEVARSGEAIEFEETVVFKDHTRSFISQKFPLRTTDGSVYAVCGISTDITERKNAEKHLRVVMAELNHRVKNTLASVQALARVTANNAPSMDAFRKAFADRLTSMGVAHSLLTRSDWRGANIRDIITSEVEPRVAASDRLEIEGPELAIRPKSALSLHMAIHEMATNAAKYGALSTPEGRLRIRWRIVTSRETTGVEITWTERGGPTLEASHTEGFGSQMIRDMLAYELQGEVDFDFEPEGLTARIWFPLRHADTDAIVPASLTGASNSNARAGAARRKEKRAASETPAKIGADNSSERLLYVEDNSVIARSMTIFLRDLGFEVVGPIATLDGAMNAVAENTLDVALLDIDLNGERV
ncbi:MAG: chemotaxis protein CheB [Phycisphaerales bacterium]|jgi:two-component system CheB/CheR fusion protein